jgi:transposase
VALEACGGSHHWGRRLAALGHGVRLIPPQYVKPFVKRGKNDRNDAAAISVAAAQPSIGSVPVKSAEQQAAAMLLSVRELLVRQRTQLVNAMRGHAAEMGVVAPPARRAGPSCGPRLPPRMTQQCRSRRSRPSRCWAGKQITSRPSAAPSTPR